MAEKPRLFIGSSTESKKIAKYVQEDLERTVDVDIWYQGVFEPGAGILETLVDKAPTYDFALLVFGADDITTERGEQEPSVRDNVLLEFGLFLGHLGRKRTFFLFDRNRPPKIPTDLSGIIGLTYNGNRIEDNPRAMVSPACLRMQEMVEKYGIREARLRRETQLPFSERLEYLGPDQQWLLNRISREAEISQDQLEDIAGYPPNELYWRIEQLYLIGLLEKHEIDRVEEYPRYEYRLSPGYTRHLETRRANAQRRR